MAADYLDRLPPKLRRAGDCSLGEIELLPGDGAAGFGILYEDEYILVIRDRVRFPDGKEGAYLRIVNTSEISGSPGTVVIPTWRDNVIFIRIFRHATRQWEWELPRGFQDPNITEEENASRETREELGVEVAGLRRIGELNANTGLLTGLIGVYAVELADDPGTAGRTEVAEGIAECRAVPADEIPEFVRNEGVRCGISLAALYLYLHAK